MALSDMLTLPLKQASEILSQPTQPTASPAAYADETDKATMQQNLPAFFRQAAQNIAQAESVRQAQQQEFDARQAADAQQAANAQAAQDAADAQMRAQNDATMQEAQQSYLNELNQQTQAAAPTPSSDLTPAAQTQGPEGALTQAGGGLWGALTDVAKAVTAPVGHAIEAGIEKGGEAISNAPIPHAQTIGTAVENLPRAAAKFKEVFGHEFQQETGQRLNLESAYNAIINSPGQEADEALAHTLDPLVNNSIGNYSPRAAQIITGALDQAGAMAPYVLIGMLAPPLEAPMAATFALQGVAGVKEVTEAYRAGQIDGKTALLGIGLNGSMVGAPFAGPMLSHIMPYFKGPVAASKAIAELDAITGKSEGASQLTRGLRAAEELQKNVPTTEQLAEQKFGPDAALTREERMSRAAAGLDPNVDAVGEQVRQMTPAPDLTARAAQAAAATPPERPSVVINEQPQTPSMAHADRHVLRTPEGGMVDYRGTHINDINNGGNRGQGTPLLKAAMDDIWSRHPGETITGDMNTPEAVRLRAKIEGTTFTDRTGKPLTADEAAAAASRHEGPLAETPFPVAERFTPETKAIKNEGRGFGDRPVGEMTPEERAAMFGTTKGAGEAAPTSPVEAAASLPGEGWIHDTFDGVPRQPMGGTTHGRVYQRPDGTFDVFDRKWSDVKTGQTAGAPESIQNFKTLAEARNHLTKLTLAGSKTIQEREAAFHEAAQTLIADEKVRKEAPVREATAVSEAHQRELNAEKPNAPRVQREAMETSRAAQTFDAGVMATKDTGGATISRTGEITPLAGKYLVGDETPGAQIPFDQFSSQSIIDYVKSHQNRFLDDPNAHIGTEVVWEDGNHHPLTEAEGGQKFVNIDAVTPFEDKAAAEEFAKTLPAGHVHDFTSEGTGMLMNAKGEEVAPVERVKKPKPGEVPQWQARGRTKIEPPIERGPERSLGGRTWGFLSGDEGKLDVAKLGSIAGDWFKAAKAGVGRVIAKIKEIGRTFNSSEVGAIFLGKKKVEGLDPKDILDFGASRRWLFPGESWTKWADEMVARVGATKEFWDSRRGDIRVHAEKMMGLTGEGLQGQLKKGADSARFGMEAGPATYERLIKLFDEGSILHQKGNTIDMRKWYNRFWPVIREHFGDDAEIFTKMMALTQSNNSPASGVPIAMRAYIQWKLGDPIGRMGSKTIREGMESLLMGKNPEGPKINPFWEALRFIGARGRNAVAVDRWVIGALGGKAKGPGMDVKALQGNHQFIRFSQSLIKMAADEAGVEPRAFQAAIWGGFRKEWDSMLKAAGGRPQGGDNNYFENLLVNTFKDYSLRSPVDFRLNSSEVVQRQLSGNLAADMVEEWQQLRAKEVGAFLHTSTKNADAIMKEMQMNEWNTKLAVAHVLDTGEIPAHLTTPAVVDEVMSQAANYKRAFEDRVSMADDATLKSLVAVPDWQKRIVDSTLDQRKRLGETVTPAWTALPRDEQKRLQTLGWMRIPENPKDVARTLGLLADLDRIKTPEELERWMGRAGVKDIVGDKSEFIGKMKDTGEEYINAAGDVAMKKEFSPYWESRSFYENRKVLNVEKVKTELRKRFPVDQNQSRNGAATLKLKSVAENLGECGLKAAG